MSLRFAPALQETLDGLDPELAGPAQAIGIGLAGQLERLRPAISRGDGASLSSDAELVSLDLAPEGEPDALSLAACAAAHRAYVASRGARESTSLGALAIARLLVWAQRAALLGTAPRIVWIGPPQRRPTDATGITVRASAVAVIDGTRRSAAAVAVVERPGP